MDESSPRARFLVAGPLIAGRTIVLSRAESAHARARRLSRGDGVVLADAAGAQARGHIAKADKIGIEVIVETVEAAPTPADAIDLLVSGLRPARLAWIAEKAAELGVTRLHVVQTARTQGFRASESSVARLSRVVREAAKQSEASASTQVAGPLAFSQAVSLFPSSARLFLDLEADPFPPTLSSPVAILVGPEGGWTDDERAAARDAGWSFAALPAGKLRAETAAVAALVLARAALARAVGGRR